MAAPERAAAIEGALRARLAPAHVAVEDESHRHRGHAGAASGGGHFRITIVSAAFAGRGRLERHRMVYDALGDAVGREIHALALRALTPDEWQATRSGARSEAQPSEAGGWSREARPGPSRKGSTRGGTRGSD